MTTTVKLANTRPVSQDKAFYVADPAYGDMREIVCHERPMMFVLHYYFGLDVPYELLRDRYFFSLDEDGQLLGRSNLMMDFFLRSGIVEEVSKRIEGRPIEELLDGEFRQDTALVLPTAKVVAGDRLVTSVMAEGGEASVLVSSLRGDDFYIRRSEDARALANRLAVDDGVLRFIRFRVPGELVSGGDVRAFTREISSFSAFELATRLERFRSTKADGMVKVGADALAGFLEGQRLQLAKYTQQLREGFSNVMLARILWPMTFCYLPFVIASRRMAERQELPGDIGALAKGIGDLTGLAANLGHLYARSTDQVMADRFFGTLARVIDEYRKLEAWVVDGVAP